MKVNIGNYPRWIGPYQIADAVFFWVDKYPDLKYETKAEIKAYEARVDYRLKEWFGEFLAHGFQKRDPLDYSLGGSREITWFYKLLSWIHSKQKQKVKIKIDPWDSWNCDSTLSPIILPLLKQLRETKHGSGYIELEDVPEHLRSTAAPAKENDWDTDDNHFKRWDWVLEELIWTFTQIKEDNWESQYHKDLGEIDFDSSKEDDTISWKRKPVIDWEGRNKHQERITNGLKLFGKYYQALWD